VAEVLEHGDAAMQLVFYRLGKDHAVPGTRWLGNSYLIPEGFMTRNKCKKLLPKKIHNTMTYGIPYRQGRVSLLPG
jgi:hypothetical protein